MMEVKVIDREFPSTDGIHQLKGKVYIPEGEPKAIFHVVHGMTEQVGLENLSSELTRIFKCGEFYTNPAYVIHKLSDMKNMYEPDSCMHKVAAAVEVEGLWLLKTRGNIFVSEAKTALAKRQAANDGSEGGNRNG